MELVAPFSVQGLLWRSHAEVDLTLWSNLACDDDDFLRYFSLEFS